MRLLKSVLPVALSVLFSAVAQAQPQVSVYNWTDYIGPKPPSPTSRPKPGSR
jgi:putrescine transport system substrate-binding protein